AAMSALGSLSALPTTVGTPSPPPISPPASPNSGVRPADGKMEGRAERESTLPGVARSVGPSSGAMLVAEPEGALPDVLTTLGIAVLTSLVEGAGLRCTSRSAG